MARPKEWWGILLDPVASAHCGVPQSSALVNIITGELGRSVGQQEGSAEGLGQAGLMGQGNEVQHQQVPGPALGSQH